MSKAAGNLIERMERETGQRIDANAALSPPLAGLLGAMSRLMGYSPASYTERDNMVAGMLIRHQMTPEYQQEQEAKELMAQLLTSGMSPDDVKSIMG